MQTDNLSPANLIKRAVSPTPSFWKKMQLLALKAGAVAAIIAAAPVALPAAVVTIAGYVALASGTIATMAQFTTDKTRETPAQ